MSSKFFNNASGNTLFDKLKGIASGMANFDRFLAVVGFFRSSGYFKLRKELKDVEEIKILVGINIDDIAKPKEEHLFYTKGRGCDAKGFYQTSGFTVLKGSIIAKSSVPSLTWKEKREKLLKEYTVSNGDKLKLESDKTFSSPSTAADFCIGSSNNGWLVWKDKDG